MATRTYIAYRIVNSVNGLSYVGITCMALRQRWWKHTSVARSGSTNRLYVAMREYGEDSFRVEPLACALADGDRWETERALIAQWNTCDQGYNELPGVPRTIDDPGVPVCFTADRPPMSDERRAALRARFLGRVDSPETRRRKSEAQRARLAAGGNRHAVGVERGAAFRTKLSRARGGVGTVLYDGVEYPSIALAAEAAGVSKATLGQWVKRFGRQLPKMIPGCGRRRARAA